MEFLARFSPFQATLRNEHLCSLTDRLTNNSVWRFKNAYEINALTWLHLINTRVGIARNPELYMWCYIPLCAPLCKKKWIPFEDKSSNGIFRFSRILSSAWSLLLCFWYYKLVTKILLYLFTIIIKSWSFLLYKCTMLEQTDVDVSRSWEYDLLKVVCGTHN